MEQLELQEALVQQALLDHKVPQVLPESLEVKVRREQQDRLAFKVALARPGRLELEFKVQLARLVEHFLHKLTNSLVLELGQNPQVQGKFYLNALLVAAEVAQD